VRRGVWFEPKGAGGVYIPCDQNLTKQIEDGFKKLWIQKDFKEERDSKDCYVDPRWPLLGPHMGEFVLYSSSNTAFIQVDALTSKLSRVVLRNQGTKIIRGWEETLRVQSGKKMEEVVQAVQAQRAEKDLDLDYGKDKPEILSPVKNISDSHRKINHLIFVVHGIGQKLSEHVDAMSFTNGNLLIY
jgi:hypothetical protein